VAYCPRILEYFIVVSTLECLVTEKMYRFVFTQELKAEALTPTSRKNVNTNLTTNAEFNGVIPERPTQSFHHLLANLVVLVVLKEFVTLRLRAAATDGGNVEHPLAKLYKGSPFYR